MGSTSFSDLFTIRFKRLDFVRFVLNICPKEHAEERI